MRVLALSLFTLSLIVSAATAEAAAPSNLRNFGTAYCNKGMACPSDEDNENPDRIIGLANGCVSMYFGLPNNKPHFDDARGLDYNYCLTPLPVAKDASGGLSMEPRCCVIADEAQEDRCMMKCELQGVR